MLSLTYAISLFIVYFLVVALFFRLYCRNRIYLLLLSEPAYMEHYIDRLPHMRERPDERIGMIEFMLSKRRAFIRRSLQCIGLATAAYLLALLGGAQG
ncbi:MAG: hypothetical protein ACLGQH_01180 [Acidobacteriota bacterium]